MLHSRTNNDIRRLFGRPDLAICSNHVTSFQKNIYLYVNKPNSPVELTELKAEIRHVFGHIVILYII